MSASTLKTLDRNVAKARAKDSLRAFAKLTHRVDGELRIISDPPLIVPVEELAEGVRREAIEAEIRGSMRSYRRTLQRDRRHLLEGYRYVHMARKVVGVGSVGTRAWIALFLGRDDQDPLFLQAKEAEASVLEPYVGGERLRQPRPAGGGGPADDAGGERHLPRLAAGVVGTRRRNRATSTSASSGTRSSRPVVEAMSPKMLAIYGQACGWTLARAHARTGDRVGIASYLGNSDSFDRALHAFAEAYADQNERDYRALADAVRDGRVAATTGL